MPKPTIDESKCNLCLTCIEICPMNVFKKGETKIEIVSPDDCIGCRACEAQCSQHVIKIEE
ncbi:4Fe-4S binding protein [Candidatus Woesearchaeota archaeon]|jgi:NAD-dependent dihydropyrimidine dehydrogenase PreA subunit|nr:4Fe-4S binding protein [Candidatus Woesearchaeota archaeon]